jgi:fructoselysine-6-P-deglycase FrlB-like protein
MLPGADAIAEAVSRAGHDGTPIVVTGCGTSEHGAMAIAEQLADALRATGTAVRVEARQALDAAIDPRAGGLCIAVSHEGTTRATVLALEAARAAGAATASVGAQRESPLALLADHKLTTPLVDGSWCHTVAYASSILAGAAIGRAITHSETDAGSAIQETLAQRERIDALADDPRDVSRLSRSACADLVTGAVGARSEDRGGAHTLHGAAPRVAPARPPRRLRRRPDIARPLRRRPTWRSSP